MKCDTCGAELAAVEIHYYERRCEKCEGEWMDAIRTWREGGRNDYFDELYGWPSSE